MPISGYVNGNHIDIYGSGSYSSSNVYSEVTVNVNETRHYYGFIEGTAIYGSYTHTNSFSSSAGAPIASTAPGSFVANRSCAQCPPPVLPNPYNLYTNDISVQMRYFY